MTGQKGYNTSKYYKANFDCTNFASQCLEAGEKNELAKVQTIIVLLNDRILVMGKCQYF